MFHHLQSSKSKNCGYNRKNVVEFDIKEDGVSMSSLLTVYSKPRGMFLV
jgi:hypothetical protein